MVIRNKIVIFIVSVICLAVMAYSGFRAGRCYEKPISYNEGYVAGGQRGLVEGQKLGYIDGYSSGQEYGFDDGYDNGYYEGLIEGKSETPVIIDSVGKQVLLGYMEEARSTHQYYVEHPDRLKPGFGDVEFHQEWVDRYDKIIAYIGMTSGEN